MEGHFPCKSCLSVVLALYCYDLHFKRLTIIIIPMHEALRKILVLWLVSFAFSEEAAEDESVKTVFRTSHDIFILAIHVPHFHILRRQIG